MLKHRLPSFHLRHTGTLHGHHISRVKIRTHNPTLRQKLSVLFHFQYADLFVLQIMDSLHVFRVHSTPDRVLQHAQPI